MYIYLQKESFFDWPPGCTVKAQGRLNSTQHRSCTGESGLPGRESSSVTGPREGRWRVTACVYWKQKKMEYNVSGLKRCNKYTRLKVILQTSTKKSTAGYNLYNFEHQIQAEWTQPTLFMRHMITMYCMSMTNMKIDFLSILNAI